MNVPWTVVPIRSWPGANTEERRRSPFSSGWARPLNFGGQSTLGMLDRELGMLDADNVVIQIAVTDSEIRLDGALRANARPQHPGVILTFDSAHGPLSYPCDAFTDWKANVHAIVLALEALRKVDRYGVTKHGEQYTGWKALPGPGMSTSIMTTQAAAAVLVRIEDRNEEAEWLLEDWEHVNTAYRNAVKKAHPDTGGDEGDFLLLQEAVTVLRRHHGIA